MGVKPASAAAERNSTPNVVSSCDGDLLAQRFIAGSHCWYEVWRRSLSVERSEETVSLRAVQKVFHTAMLQRRPSNLCPRCSLRMRGGTGTYHEGSTGTHWPRNSRGLRFPSARFDISASARLFDSTASGACAHLERRPRTSARCSASPLRRRRRLAHRKAAAQGSVAASHRAWKAQGDLQRRGVGAALAAVENWLGAGTSKDVPNVGSLGNADQATSLRGFDAIHAAVVTLLGLGASQDVPRASCAGGADQATSLQAAVLPRRSSRQPFWRRVRACRIDASLQL
mmetsp:Transcript_54521/g.152033  ORF Transcript_54521/g.152033 Transcript_54521/m.152033 type:complete len:285 (+) Transcript_54521:1892-2746(+)